MGEMKKVRENDHTQMSNLIVDDERLMTLDQAVQEAKEGQIKKANTTEVKNESGRH